MRQQTLMFVLIPMNREAPFFEQQRASATAMKSGSMPTNAPVPKSFPTDRMESDAV